MPPRAEKKSNPQGLSGPSQECADAKVRRVDGRAPFRPSSTRAVQCTVYVADSSNFWVLSADSNVFRLSASVVMKRTAPFPKQQFCASFFANSPPSQVVARSALIVPAAVTLCTGDLVLSRVGSGKSADLFVPHCFICATSDNMCVERG
jgi:hypothetical protein